MAGTASVAAFQRIDCTYTSACDMTSLVNFLVFELKKRDSRCYLHDTTLDDSPRMKN